MLKIYSKRLPRCLDLFGISVCKCMEKYSRNMLEKYWVDMLQKYSSKMSCSSIYVWKIPRVYVIVRVERPTIHIANRVE